MSVHRRDSALRGRRVGIVRPPPLFIFCGVPVDVVVLGPRFSSLRAPAASSFSASPGRTVEAETRGRTYSALDRQRW